MMAGKASLPQAEFLDDTTMAASTMAGAAMFLASKASAFVTGTILPVDGGTATTL